LAVFSGQETQIKPALSLFALLRLRREFWFHTAQRKSGSRLCIMRWLSIQFSDLALFLRINSHKTKLLLFVKMPPARRTRATAKSPFAWTCAKMRSVVHQGHIASGGSGDVHKVLHSRPC
jgi:hypothetical protein